MKLKIALLAASAVTVGFVGITVGASSSNDFKNLAIQTRAGARDVNFNSADITRRIYVLNNDNWWTSDTLYVHIWGGVGSFGEYWSGALTYVTIDGGWYNGLMYVDITGVGAGAAFNAQIKNDSGSTAGYYTNGVSIPALSSNEPDVIWMHSGYDGSGNRNASIGTGGGSMSAGKLADILETTYSCSDSYANGYNAYPQLNANFFAPNKTEIDTYGSATPLDDYDYEEYNGKGKSYDGLTRKSNKTNVADKVDMLSTMYSTYGWTK